MALLCHCRKFRDKISKLRGISSLCFELDVRKKRNRILKRGRGTHIDENPDEAEEIDTLTEILFGVMKEDWAAIKIQSLFRANLARTKSTSTRRLEGSYSNIYGSVDKEDL